MTKKIFIACLGTETNSFSPIPTGLELFRQTMLVRGGAHGERPNLFALPLQVWRRRAEKLGWQVVESVAAFAMPAGDTTRHAYQSLRDEILADLRTALPVDAVLLNLHGAMIADGYPDAEGDLMARVRDIIGPGVPFGAELDLHCHLTDLKVEAPNAIVIFKEYPHVDVTDRAEELFTIIEKTLDGTVWPVMAMQDCRMLGIYPTTREPLRSFVDRMAALEGKDGILSVSLGHGFPWGDTPEVGTRVLVVADADRDKATALADRLGREIWDMRHDLVPPFQSVEEAVTRVAGHNDVKPLVLADVADNPGIGAAGDSTFMLRRFIERKVGRVAISPFWDPITTALAFDAGVGARIRVRLGGKLGSASGDPVDANVTVMNLVRDAYQPFGKSLAPLGNMAWLRIGESDDDAIDVAVNDHRVQSFHPDCFSAVGIDPHKRRGLIVKSTQHFHAGFAPLAAEILYVSAPGTGSMDMRALPYTRVTRALWPLVEDPHGTK